MDLYLGIRCALLEHAYFMCRMVQVQAQNQTEKNLANELVLEIENELSVAREAHMLSKKDDCKS